MSIFLLRSNYFMEQNDLFCDLGSETCYISIFEHACICLIYVLNLDIL